MENHYVQWTNPLFLAIFHSDVNLPEGILRRWIWGLSMSQHSLCLCELTFSPHWGLRLTSASPEIEVIRGSFMRCIRLYLSLNHRSYIIHIAICHICPWNPAFHLHGIHEDHLFWCKKTPGFFYGRACGLGCEWPENSAGAWADDTWWLHPSSLLSDRVVQKCPAIYT